ADRTNSGSSRKAASPRRNAHPVSFRSRRYDRRSELMAQIVRLRTVRAHPDARALAHRIALRLSRTSAFAAGRNSRCLADLFGCRWSLRISEARWQKSLIAHRRKDGKLASLYRPGTRRLLQPGEPLERPH